MSLRIEDDPKIGSEEMQIIGFITKKGFASWSDMKKHFVTSKKWHNSTFVKHWNNIKEKYVEKVKNEKTGYPWYKIVNQAKNIGEKAVLSTDIQTGVVSSIEISQERFKVAANQIAETSALAITNTMNTIEKAIKNAKQKRLSKNPTEPVDSDSFVNMMYESIEKRFSDSKGTNSNKGVFEKLKNIVITSKAGGEQSPKLDDSGIANILALIITEQMETEKIKNQLIAAFQQMKIQIVNEPGETAPVLTDDDIIKLVSVALPKVIDENKGKQREKPFKIVISFPSLE